MEIINRKIILDIVRFLFLNNVKNISEIKIRQLVESIQHLNNDAIITSIIEEFGFRSKTVSLMQSELSSLNNLPFFIEQKPNDFILVESINNKLVSYNSIDDSTISINKLLSTKDENIECIFFEKNRSKKSKSIHKIILDYFVPHKRYFYQIIFGIIVITLLQFISPFLMQLFIDKGIVVEDFSLIKIVIIGLIVIQLSKFIAEFIRSWLYLHIGVRINISMVSDFITNVLNLPIHFFNSSTVGDLLQRVDDNKRIENFLTKSIINLIFNVITIIIFLVILGYFNLKIFAVFVIGNILFISWMLVFWKIRKEMDMSIFRLNSKNQNILIQLLQSVQDIKLFNIEKEKRWDWEDNQVELFKNKQKMMIIEQLQDGVSLFINETKNYIILYLCAVSIIDGSMSFGSMIAIQYILGQTSLPIRSITGFIMEYQMALISFQRISEITNIKPPTNNAEIITSISNLPSLQLKNVTFQYQDSKKSFMLRNVTMKFEGGKTTAIIGKSGSGKTTILKLLLKFYNPYKGDIYVNDLNLRNINTNLWRDKCGALLQDSIIFNDTILNNITMSKEYNLNKVIEVCKMSNILEFIENSKDGFNTILNYAGRGMSQGQIQRLLIARLMYKNPDVVLLDEVTSSLDSKTESSIVNHFKEFFKDKTVIIISHRLSSIKHADRYIVIDDGKVLEYGDHDFLIAKDGYYASLFK